MGGGARTDLYYENAWNVDTFRRATLLAGWSVVDVTAQVVDSVPSIRYAISNINLGADGHGPTSYRTGRWTGAATAPTWTHTPIQISESGTNAEALFYRKSTVFSTRYVPAVYEQLIDDVSSIVEETTTVTNPNTPGPWEPAPKKM